MIKPTKFPFNSVNCFKASSMQKGKNAKKNEDETESEASSVTSFIGTIESRTDD